MLTNFPFLNHSSAGLVPSPAAYFPAPKKKGIEF